MPLRSDWSTKNCPVARGVDIFADPWTVLVLREIFLGNHRFDGLRSALSIADNSLSDRLRRLVESGLLRKQPYGQGARPRVDYLLTDAGRDALPVLNALSQWADKHTPSPTGRTMGVYCTTCGTVATSADWCTTCQSPLTAETTAWERPQEPGILVALGSTPEPLGSTPEPLVPPGIPEKR